MATTKGLGWFDTTYYGPTYTEDIDAINQGIEQGLKIGAAVRERQAENRRQQADYEANRQKQIVNELTLNKLDNESREGLILKPASKSDNLNDARVDFSNMLVDKFNQLKIARDAGDLTAADYSKGLMVLQQQVPAYKAAEKIMYTGVEQYLDALDDGTLSESNDPEALEFWGAIARGDADVSYKIGDDGNIFLTGTWNDSNGKAQPIDAALKEMERLPFLSKKPETTVKQQLEADVSNILATKKGNAMKAFNEKTGKYQEDYNPISNPDGTPTTWFKQFADESFDGYFSGLGGGNKKKALKEYLLDSLEVQDRVELMDKLAQYTNKSDKNGSAESYGLATVNELVNDLTPDQIKSFINSTVKGSWIDQTRNAVLKANKELIDKANLAQSEASLEYRKDLANTRKAEYQAESARKSAFESKPDEKDNKLQTALSDLNEAGFQKNQAGVWVGSLPSTNEKLAETLEGLGFVLNKSLGANKGFEVKPQGGGGSFEIKTGETSQEFIRKFLMSRKINDATAKAEAYTFDNQPDSRTKFNYAD